MNRQFATLREAVEAAECPPGPPGHDHREAGKSAFRELQVAGKIVMIDRACPYDPPGAVIMLLIAGQGRGASLPLVRAPLTAVEIRALLGFAVAQGSPEAGAAADKAGLLARVAEMEQELSALRARCQVKWPRGKLTRGALAALLAQPFVRRDRLAKSFYGGADPHACHKVDYLIYTLRQRLPRLGARIVTVTGGYRLIADGEARERLQALLEEP
jgi:hypothetical protein